MATPKPTGAVANARKKQPPWLWIGVAAVVVVLAVAALVSTGGSDKNKSTTLEGLEQTRPVTVTGTALPKLPSSGTDPAVGQVIPEARGQSFGGTPVDIRSDGRPKLIL